MTCTTKISLWAVTVLRLWILMAATSLSPLATFAYDTQRQIIIKYDAPRATSLIGCDAACALSQHEGESETCGTWGLFGSFAKFLAAEETQTLFHYTNEKGLAGILDSGELNPSLKALNPNDVRYGNGQYLSDIVPGTRTRSELSYDFLGNPFQGQKYTHFIEIDVSGLNVVPGRPGVFVIPGETPLDLTGRIISSGAHLK